ncbi:unnamed protein product [Notodromas monacha]|uniref:Nuclear autoantigenic sperm protein n=1 Tax=Notodromas monacha TaxID=399045 RepID=A0A7R9GIG1_9CRUS|nr:unnamed protein product [Notodromas monacha]CAG0923817.1 unnamed protein product [Notodromas monacha]
MDRIYGEGSDALGEAYLCYGQALLGVEQMDESLFQKGEVNGMEEAAEEEDDDDEDEDDEEEGEGEAQDQDEDEGKEEVADGEKIVNGDAAAAEEPEKVTNGDSTEESKEPNGEEVTTDSPAPGPSGVQNTDEAEEQITNMQVAWEVTEMARNIFLARSGDDPDNLKKLGRAYATLAEIAGISRQFVESAADFQRALEILQKTQNSLREQAEILYLRSNALVSCNRFDEAVEALRGAMDLLTKHQDDLKEGSHPDRTEEDIKKGPDFLNI